MSDAQMPETITVKQTTVDNLIDQLAQAKLDEALLAALLFGDDQAAGKGFREMAAEIRRRHEDHTVALMHLDAIIYAYQTNEGIGRLLIAIREAKEWRGVATETAGQGDSLTVKGVA